MAKYTPWTAKPRNGIWFLHNSRGDTLARFTIGSAEAAQLSAAAPALLEALAKIVEPMELIESLAPPLKPQMQAALDSARAAIKKATDNA